MGLSLKDRYRLVKMFVKVIFSDTPQIGLTWKEGTRILSYHVYNENEVKRYTLHLEYMGQVAAHTKSLDHLNGALEYFAKTSLVGYCSHNKISKEDLILIPPRVIYVADKDNREETYDK